MAARRSGMEALSRRRRRGQRWARGSLSGGRAGVTWWDTGKEGRARRWGLWLRPWLGLRAAWESSEAVWGRPAGRGLPNLAGASTRLHSGDAGLGRRLAAGGWSRPWQCACLPRKHSQWACPGCVRRPAPSSSAHPTASESSPRLSYPGRCSKPRSRRFRPLHPQPAQGFPFLLLPGLRTASPIQGGSRISNDPFNVPLRTRRPIHSIAPPPPPRLGLETSPGSP